MSKEQKITKKKPLPSSEVGELFKAARRDLGWTQEKFSEMADVSIGTIRKAECGGALSPYCHVQLREVINKYRAMLTPPLDPLSIPYPGMENHNAPSTCANSSPPNNSPLEGIENPFNHALHEAMCEYGHPHGENHFRVGPIPSQAALFDLWKIDEEGYGSDSIGFEQFVEMWRAFPNGLHVLYLDDEIVGAMGIWPLSKRCAANLVAGKISEREIKGASLKASANRPASTWYISGIVLKKKFMGGRAIRVLLPAALSAWFNLPIKFPCQLLAIASSAQGENLLKRFRFFRMQHGQDMPDGHPLYALNVASRAELIEQLQSFRLRIA
jgi:transcriptional regulator with XRE-family HTH domain